MPPIELRPISESEYLAWNKASITGYAKDKEKEGLSPEDAMAESEKSFHSLLPQQEKTPDHFIYSLIEQGSASPVGTIWWAKRKNGSKDYAWIYDIVILPGYRGRGFGKQAMQLAMKDVQAKGIHGLGLHVFGHNEVAQNLYRSLGFRTTNIVMQIDL